VYARELDGRTLTLAVDGRLWKDAMVLYDVETQSRWSFPDGEARLGTLKGKKLSVLPSAISDWKSWRETHPDGTVAWVEK